ncbi:hypothetical protein GQ44DRAFT_711250 [Phaeosphaeriaceae sp. PMI808]|nr:hypothetical protein GQ44DRAFT_711250 [Phaeosphaeriaceae sp. PMI808]
MKCGFDVFILEWACCCCVHCSVMPSVVPLVAHTVHSKLSRPALTVSGAANLTPSGPRINASSAPGKSLVSLPLRIIGTYSPAYTGHTPNKLLCDILHQRSAH